MLYGFGIPLGFFVILYRGRNRLNQTDFGKKFGYLYKRYDAEWYWWETVVLLRKLILAIINILVLTPSGSPLPVPQAALGMLTVLTFIMLQTYAMPYVEIHLDVLETVLLTVNYTFLFLGLSRNMLENMKPYAKDRTMAPLVDSFMMVVLIFGALFMVFLLAIDITLQLVRLYFRFIEGEGKYGARQILELLDLDKKTKRIQEKGLFVISIKRKQQFQKWLTKTATEEEKDLAFIAFHALHKFIMMRRKEQQDATIRRMSRVPIVGKVIASIWMQRDARRGRRRAARDSVRGSIRRDSLFSSRSTESRETRASGVGLSELSVEQTTGRRGSITTRFMSNFRSKRSGESDISLLDRDEY